MRPSTTFVAGLTGGVGSGKSTAAELFARLGAYVIDADAISHALTGRGGAAIAAIDTAFRIASSAYAIPENPSRISCAVIYGGLHTMR